ncbi:ST-I family heat-stable enterotoxin [Neorhizobium tomejilense]
MRKGTQSERCRNSNYCGEICCFPATLRFGIVRSRQ